MNDLLRRILFLPEQASTFSVPVDHLHYFVILTTMIASVGVGSTALLFFVIYRRKTPHQRTPRIVPTFAIEAAIIGIPLAFFIVWFWMGFGDFIFLQQPPPDAMDVYVSAKQWMWEFSYPEGPNAIATLHVPAHRPVRLLMTSRDVIHSFYVPSFRIKQDILPGRYTQTWFEATRTGNFEILCSEYCGLEHSLMRGSVEVMEPDAFDAWLAQQRTGVADRQDSGPSNPDIVRVSGNLLDEGRRVAVEQGCLKCHSIDGSAHIGPTWLDLYRRRETLTNGETVVADEAYLTESMMDPLAKVVRGYKPVMPTYQGKLDAPSTAAILEYIKSLHSDRVHPVRTEGPAYEPK